MTPVTTTNNNQICALCGAAYSSPIAAGDYGLCADHWSRDFLREVDRIAATRKHVAPGAPDTLTLGEWLSVVSSHKGLCALCRQVPYSAIAIISEQDGLVCGNVAPACRACSWHLEHGWQNALDSLCRQ